MVEPREIAAIDLSLKLVAQTRSKEWIREIKRSRLTLVVVVPISVSVSVSVSISISISIELQSCWMSAIGLRLVPKGTFRTHLPLQAVSVLGTGKIAVESSSAIIGALKKADGCSGLTFKVAFSSPGDTLIVGTPSLARVERLGGSDGNSIIILVE